MDARWPICALLLLGLAAAASSAPLGDAAGPATNETGEFDAAIAEVRAKREALRKRSRLSADDASEEDASGEDDVVDVNSLAKEVALDILMAETRERDRATKKKNKSSLEDEHRKRLASLFASLMEDDESEEADDGDEDGQGLDYGDVDELIGQLDDGEDRRKKKRAGERWKIPRGGHRWRSHYVDPDEDEADEWEGRFFGRGFHRMGGPSTDKRVLRPLRTHGKTNQERNLMNKRSLETRKKRSVGEVTDGGQNDTAPPMALPLSGPVRKKSVDWDDYFGFDKRKRSSQDDDDGPVKDYLEGEYYKAIAGSLAYRRKRAGHAGHVMKRANWTLPARVRARLVAELIGELEPDDVDELGERLTHDLVLTLRENDRADEAPYRKRAAFKRRPADEKRKRQPDDDTRRKRLPVKRRDPDDDECVIAEQVAATCNTVSHLYGGYRPVLSDACFRRQACSICSDGGEACGVEYRRRVMALCGPDLLCQSQSRHVLAALEQLDEMEPGPSAANQRQVEALCRRDACLADLYKRR